MIHNYTNAGSFKDKIPMNKCYMESVKPITMNTFSKILLKQNSDSTEVFNSDKESPVNLWKNVYEHELNVTILTPIELRVVKMMIYFYISNPLLYSPSQKFGYLNTVFNNQFYNTATKSLFVNVFNSSQRHYYVLSKFVNRMKMRFFKPRIQCDLYMNPISEKQQNVVSIIHSNTKYLFTFMDLTKIIDTSLTNSPNFFSSPLPIKNPYNNLPFTKSNLYNIYFAIKKSDFVMSALFHNYFLCNFNLKDFKQNNEVLIRKTAIANFMKTATTFTLKAMITKMVDWYNNRQTRRRDRMKISNEFPVNDLIGIMRPYAEMFIRYTYTLDMNERHYLDYKLEMKLVKFQRFNPQFGRKLFIKGHVGGLVKCEHLDFYANRKVNSLKQYQNSHLSMDCSSSEEEEEEEEGEEEEEETNIVNVNARDPSEESEEDEEDESDYDP